MRGWHNKRVVQREATTVRGQQEMLVVLMTTAVMTAIATAMVTVTVATVTAVMISATATVAAAMGTVIVAKKQQTTKTCSRKSGNGGQCSPHLNHSSLLSCTTSIQGGAKSIILSGSAKQ